MKPKTSSLEQLCKSLQTFGSLAMAAESRDKLYRYNDALMQSLYSILDDGDCDEAVKLETFNTTMEQYTAAMRELFPKLLSVQSDRPVRDIVKSDPSRYDEIVEVEVNKFNPYHDERGRFATADSHASFTYAPGKSKAHDLAIAREKERAGAAGGAKPTAETKPKKQPDKKPEKKPEKQPEKETAKPEDNKLTISRTGKTTLPDSVVDKCREVEAKTVNRKTEKMTIVDADGNVLLEKSGGKGSVSFGAREGFLMNDTTTVTHNHPGEYGGTFSGADVKVLVEYRLKAIRAVGKEGTYSLERVDTNSSKSYDFKQAYAQQSNSTNSKMRTKYQSQKGKVARGDLSVDDANKELSDYRTKLCNEQHDWLVKNAAQYGYNYVFEPSSGGVGKMFDDVDKAKEEAEDTTGETVLDGDFMSGDGWMIGSEDADE
jgi:hypothetical protein